MNATLKKHLEAIKSGAITKTNVIGLRKAVNTFAKQSRGWSTGCTSPIVSRKDLLEINQAIALNEPRVSRELDASGRKVLQDRRYRKHWTESQARIIATLDHFRFVGFHEIDRAHFVPIYKAIAPGGSFNFIVIPWQTAYAFGLQSGPQVIGSFY
ncbi:MAG: hypothetical protein E6Q97_23240 [Desulfurellales bacterium]|nr:MAG: hypothetical protein E6Q97_23240 [Desulfurellales bacterium]